MKTSIESPLYKQYKKINEPYFSFNENVVFPGLILLATMVITYFSLYFVGFPFTCFLYLLGSFFINLLFHGLKNATPNGNNYNGRSTGIPGFIVLLSLLPSYLGILSILTIANVGTYLIVQYQKTTVFNDIAFYIWAFVVFGLPVLYYVFRYAKYNYLIYSQAVNYTEISLHIKHDPEFLIKIDEIHFINFNKKRIAKCTFKKDREFESQKTLESLDIAERNKILFFPAFNERVYVPVNTNLVKIAYYSISEDTYYQDEIIFPYNQLIFEENKYPLNKSKTLRGKKTEPLSINFYEKGKIKLFTGSKLLVEITLKKDNLKDKKNNEYKEIIGSSENKEIFSPLLLDTETRERIKKREEIKQKLFNYTLNFDLSHRHLICVYDCNNNEPLRDRFTDLKIKQTITQNVLPTQLVFYCDAFNRTRWLNIHIDTEKLYDILMLNTSTIFKIDLTVNIENSSILLKIKTEDKFVEFEHWEKSIDNGSLLDIKKKIKENKKTEQRYHLYNQIYELMEKKEYTKAETICNLAIKQNPNDGMLYFYQARLLFYIHGKKACYDKEAYFIEKTSHDTRALAHIYNNYGCLLDQDLKYKESLSYFEKANELVPEMAIYIANKAEMHYKLKNKNRAFSLAQEAQKKGDTSEIVKEILMNKGKIDEINFLQIQLATLACMYRSEPENSENNTNILESYYETFNKLMQLNKSIIGLDPDAELPDHLMPKEYVDFWLTKKE
ncbi:tetratricopeptide repeat protein [Flavobacterium sp. HNIBRBA15423]|uniref:tetratricopeptide repeat protein n=1 Tax=Flavobacterium sp. HNIBRBA15423 TaxID=3458683 RepID=UPI004043F41C